MIYANPVTQQYLIAHRIRMGGEVKLYVAHGHAGQEAISEWGLPWRAAAYFREYCRRKLTGDWRLMNGDL